jgi:hypothetical protein
MWEEPWDSLLSQAFWGIFSLALIFPWWAI